MMPSPLREIDPDQPKRLHTFGNPFKQDKKGMMIDEADEFVAGPQNKKRGISNDSNSGVTLKRRRSMSPLLRRPQTPPGSTNHVALGKSTAGVQAQQNLKTVPQHKGVDSSTVVMTESNGDSGLGLDPAEMWPADMDIEATSQSPLILEEKVAAVQEEDAVVTEEQPVGDHLDEQLLEEKHNCDRLSPQSQADSTEAEPSELETIFITPLDGNQAELRTRVIKEVRKPGRNYGAIVRLLQQVKGSVDVQRYFIQHAIKEAVRFKKRVLIQQLELMLSDLEVKQAASSLLPNDHDR